MDTDRAPGRPSPTPAALGKVGSIALGLRGGFDTDTSLALAIAADDAEGGYATEALRDCPGTCPVTPRPALGRGRRTGEMRPAVGTRCVVAAALVGLRGDTWRSDAVGVTDRFPERRAEEVPSVREAGRRVGVGTRATEVPPGVVGRWVDWAWRVWAWRLPLACTWAPGAVVFVRVGVFRRGAEEGEGEAEGDGDGASPCAAPGALPPPS